MAETSVQKVIRVYKAIYLNWLKSNRFSYVVRPSREVKDKPIDEIRDVLFWAAPLADSEQSQTAVFTLNELVALFRLIADQTKQMRKNATPGVPAPAQQSYTTTVKLRPPDEDIVKTLKQIRFVEPGPV